MTTQHANRNLLRLAALATVLGLGAAMACAQQSAPADDNGPDPALANMAPADAAAAQQQTAAPASGQPDYQQAVPQQAPAPIVRSAPAPGSMPPDAAQGDDSYNAPPADAGGSQQADDQVADGQQALDDADVSADQAPPALPDYDQPPAPADNYMWIPGYWGYGGAGYYWVPGVWIVPPYYGALWTPGYWGWWGGRYRWHAGYWGTHVGFYGGVNYGFGYIGTGYFGGYWHGNAFVYNRAVTNVGVGIGFDHVYNRAVVYNGRTFGPRPSSRVSYNGGRGGIQVAPRPGEYAVMHESHTGALPGQVSLHRNAANNPQAAFNANHGRVSGSVAAQQAPLGANRPIADSQRNFQSRPQNQPRQQQPQARPQQDRPNQQQRQQSRPAPRPQSHPEPHNDKH